MKWALVLCMLCLWIYSEIDAQSIPKQKKVDSLEVQHTLLKPLVVVDDSLKIDRRENDLAYPSPSTVWKKSLVLPGWGQATNKQHWKIPVIYALLGGLAWNTHRLTKKYNDYKAAYYNLNNEDLLFGPTPTYLIDQTNGSFLQNVRDNTRQQRDQMVLGIILAYGLNVIDSYIYAHFRTFDVSDDLSLSTDFLEDVNGMPVLTMKLNIQF